MAEEKAAEKPRYSFKIYRPVLAMGAVIIAIWPNSDFTANNSFYLGLQIKKIVEVPRLLIHYPPDGLVVDRPGVCSG